MKKILTLAFVAVATLLVAVPESEAGVRVGFGGGCHGRGGVSVGFGRPRVAVGYGYPVYYSRPVYYAPAPVVYAAPVYYAPRHRRTHVGGVVVYRGR